MTLVVDTSKLTTPEDTTGNVDERRFNVGVVMMALGMRKIDNLAEIQEAMFRARFYSALFGPLMSNHETKEEILNKPLFWQRWQGVRVNVNQETRRAWIKRMVTSLESEISYQLRKEM